MQCCQHWMQSWATSLHIPLRLVLWWQNLSSRLYCLLWPLHYLQNKKTHHLFSSMTFVVKLPLLDVPSFWALVCPSWLWPSPCHPHQQQEVYSIEPWSPLQRWYTDFWLLCCQHSWSRLQPENPRKSGISHQRTHHVLASISWRPERDRKDCFQFLTVGNNAAMSIPTYILWYICSWVFLGYTQVWSCWVLIACCTNFIYCQICWAVPNFSKIDVQIDTPTMLLYIVTITWFANFLIFASLMDAWCYLIIKVLAHIYLITNEIEPCFCMFIDHLNLLFCKLPN